MCDYFMCRLLGKCVFSTQRTDEERPLFAQPDENPYVE